MPNSIRTITRRLIDGDTHMLDDGDLGRLLDFAAGRGGQGVDMLGSPIDVGDTVAYPAAAGSSAAQMHLAEVTEIIPVFPDNPSDPECAFGHTKTGTKIDQTRRTLWRRRVPGAMPDVRTSTWGRKTHTYEVWPHEYDPDRLFVLRVKRIQQGSTDYDRKSRPGVMLTNVDRVINVTPMLGDDA